MIQELGDYLIPVIAILSTFGFLAIWVVAATLDSMYKTFCNSRLKERLVQRGMSASEIERIVNAGIPSEATEADSFVQPVAPVKV